MKTPKILTLIAAILYFLAAVGIAVDIPKFSAILTNSGQSSNAMYLVPIVELIFASGSLSFWFYIRKQERQGMMVTHARLVSTILLALSIVLPFAMTVWFVLLPIYNLSSTS